LLGFTEVIDKQEEYPAEGEMIKNFCPSYLRVKKRKSFGKKRLGKIQD